MATKYLDYAGLQRLVENIDRKYAPISAIVFKNSVDDIAHLPALNTQKAGWMYNIKVGGITTSDFVEGAGHIVADGENIAAVELLTGVYTEKAVAADADPKALGLYEVESSVTYCAPKEDVTNPQAEGLYEFTAVTPVGSEDPKTLGWYEKDGDNYIASQDTTVDAGKNYATRALSTDTTVDPSKTYYEQKTDTTYKLTQDRLPVTGKKYYEAGTVMKWDLMGGVFDLEDRYLEFGDAFPQGPASRLVDGRTFLYMGDDVKVYVRVADPEGRPTDNKYFELATATAVTDRSTIVNPKQQPLYEKSDDYLETTPVADPAAENLYEVDATDPSGYKATADTTIDPTKTYYKKVAVYTRSQDIADVPAKIYYVCTFAASADTTVVEDKVYYSESDAYKKAIIYQYDATAKDWIAQSSGGAGDMDPITAQEIDELFI